MQFKMKEPKQNKTQSGLIFILNQIFEIESKVGKLQETNSIVRNINKLKDFFENGELTPGQHLIIENPIGETYTETRRDVEASISGNSTENLYIIDVIKPIIRLKTDKVNTIIQKAIVIVESKRVDEK